MKTIIKIILIFILFVSCTENNGKDDYVFNNPMDSLGTDWHPPQVINVNVHEKFTLSADAIDTNYQNQVYYWFREGILIDSTNIPQLSIVENSIVEDAIAYSVFSTDKKSFKSGVYNYVILISLAKPEMITAASDTVVVINEPFNLSVNAMDTNGAIENYYWYLGDSLIEVTTIGVLSTVINDTSSSIHEYLVYAMDEDGFNTETVKIIVSVNLMKPRIISLNSDTIVDIYKEFPLYVKAIDSNGIIENYYWFRDGILVDSMHTDIIYATEENINDTLVTYSVIAVDSDGFFSDTLKVDILVNLIKPKMIELISEKIITIHEPSKLYAKATSSNGKIQKYFWIKNGVLFDSTDIEECIVIVDDTSTIVELSVYVKDEDGFLSETLQINVPVKVMNPILVNITKKSSGYLKGSYILEADAIDSNGTIVKYYWLREGVVLDSTVHETLSVELGQRNSDSITFSVYAIDNDGLKSDTKHITIENTNYTLVEGGSFIMGDLSGAESEPGNFNITLNSFMIGRYEVTQNEWYDIMGNNPSYYSGGYLPVEKVNWYEAVEYCNKKSVKEGRDECYTIDETNVTCDFTLNGYRLPTEAEWEYAAKGGKYSNNYVHSGSNNADSVVVYSASRTAFVGTLLPNELGIYDMSGNVSEWCWDWYDEYDSIDVVDPTGPSTGDYAIIRGVSWFDTSIPSSTITLRGKTYRSYRSSYRGFRIVRNLE